MTHQENLQRQTDELCNSVRHLLVVPKLLRWKEAYARSSSIGKAEMMNDLEDLADVIEGKVLALFDKVQRIEQLLFDIEMDTSK